MLLVHYDFEENEGPIIYDKIGENNLNLVNGHKAVWSRSRVFGTENKSILGKRISSSGGQGVPQPTIPQSPYDVFESVSTINPGIAVSLAMVIRPVYNVNGTFLDFSNHYFTNWNGNLQIVSPNIVLASEFERSKWLFLVVTREGTNTHVYLNGQWLRTLSVSLSISGTIRLNGLTSSSMPGAMEWADLKIFNHTLSQSEITELYNDLGAAPNKWSLISDGGDMGNIPESCEGIDYSYNEIVNGVTRVMFNNDTCIGGRRFNNPSSLKNGEIWLKYELRVPGNFAANHNLGNKFTLFVIGKSSSTLSNEHIWVFLKHTMGTETIENWETLVYNGVGDDPDRFPMLETFQLQKDVWIKCKMHVDYQNGIIEVWYNGMKITDISDYNFTYDLGDGHFGLHQGVHPEDREGTTDPYIEMRNLFVGEFDPDVINDVIISDNFNLDMNLSL